MLHVIPQHRRSPFPSIHRLGSRSLLIHAILDAEISCLRGRSLVCAMTFATKPCAFHFPPTEPLNE